jgi:hypothetical protein
MRYLGAQANRLVSYGVMIMTALTGWLFGQLVG